MKIKRNHAKNMRYCVIFFCIWYVITRNIFLQQYFQTNCWCIWFWWSQLFSWNMSSLKNFLKVKINYVAFTSLMMNSLVPHDDSLLRNDSKNFARALKIFHYISLNYLWVWNLSSKRFKNLFFVYMFRFFRFIQAFLFCFYE